MLPGVAGPNSLAYHCPWGHGCQRMADLKGGRICENPSLQGQDCTVKGRMQEMKGQGMPTLVDMSVWGQPPPELPGGQPLGEACDPTPQCPPSPLERKWAFDSRRLSPRGPVLLHALRYQPFLGCELGNSKSIRLLPCAGDKMY